MDESQHTREEKNEQDSTGEKKLHVSPLHPTDVKQELPDMEVHHHPDLHHKSKPWKEYLLEGLMIFIAVMLGFIGENIREGISNREHVRELTSQLLRDLKSDTAQLNEIYHGEQRILRANDSLVDLSQQPLSKVNTELLVRLVVRSHSLWPFHASSGAIAAIKNELHLKQFSSSEIIGYISEYEGRIELLHLVQEITLQYQRNFIDPFLLRHLNSANLNAAFNHSTLPNPEKLSISQEDFDQVGAQMVLIGINTNELLDDNRKIKTTAENLIQYLKKQYGLEEE